MPQLYNPPEGLIVSANQRVVDDAYPYFISHEWAPPYRAEAIRRELEGRQDLTLADMKALDALAIGNSGHPFSPHYDDQLALWLEMDYKVLSFERAEIMELENRLLFLPLSS